MDTFGIIGIDILTERKRQDMKWGVSSHNPFIWLAIIGEELGEASDKALSSDLPGFRHELIQVAASCIACVEAIDDGRYPKHWRNLISGQGVR